MSTLSDIAARALPFLKTRSGALALVAALQLGVLGWIVADRVRLVKTGREIVLPIIPVDPRDIFKGDYVRLAYDVSLVPAKPAQDLGLPKNGIVFVTLAPQDGGAWSVAGTSATYPATIAAGQAVLRGRLETFGRPGVVDARNGGKLRVRYGLERYYVPEGNGPALEKLARDKKLAAIISVDSRGNAAIKGLSADGVKIYDEPLF